MHAWEWDTMILSGRPTMLQHSFLLRLRSKQYLYVNVTESERRPGLEAEPAPISWDKVCRPKLLGGLGILNMEKNSRALRLRWMWHEWASPDKPWVGSETPNDYADRSHFNAATRVTIGDGLKASFWGSSWLDGLPP